MHIVHTTPYLMPEAGGPARSVPSLCDALADRGLTNDLLSIYLGKQFEKSLVTQHVNNKTYLVPSYFSLKMTAILIPGLHRRLNRVVRGSDTSIIHDHCPFVPIHRLAVRTATRHHIPLIISTRGMLEPNSLSHHPIRKKIAWSSYQRRYLQTAGALHATSSREAYNLMTMKLGVPVAVIPNGISLPPSKNYNRPEIMPANSRIVLFLARLLNQKGAEKLIKAFAKMPSKGWHLVIAGPDEDDQLSLLKALVGRLNLGDSVSFSGAISDADKWAFYSHSDIFALPTKTENFGNVIAEALATGTPVITTKGAPWPMLQTHQCGWWIDDSQSALDHALLDAMALGYEARSELGARGRALIASRFNWTTVAATMHELYSWVQTRHTESKDRLIAPCDSAQSDDTTPDFIQFS